ncbi:hypothetical protein INT47_010122 [Mucor saturninus]|uniref:Uncharacterized protein n=1 Tax=Mucor saturninus TaxID=64648 RepID=A0A8H7QIE7_9FUNG|nr:hypothetical protein INT47_010122 [Mucor saturninus]
MGCPKHGGEQSSHTAAECTTKDNVFKKGKFLGDANYPYKATRNPMKYWDAKGIKGKTVLAVHAEQEQTTPSKIKKAMEVVPYECKNTKVITRIDTGSDISCINKYILENQFDNKVKISKNHLNIMESQFDVLLGLDILTKLRISLFGVAYCYPDEGTTLAQFQNVNFDTEIKYDPENADYGTEMEREHFLSKIRNAVNGNKCGDLARL